MRLYDNPLLYPIQGPFLYPPTDDASAGSRWPAALAWLTGLLTDWQQRHARRWRIRRATFELARLDDRMLADIGITRLDIAAAAGGVPLRQRDLPVEPLRS